MRVFWVIFVAGALVWLAGCQQTGVALCRHGEDHGTLYKLDDCSKSTALTFWAAPGGSQELDNVWVRCMVEAQSRCNTEEYKGTHRGFACWMRGDAANEYVTYHCDETAIVRSEGGKEERVPYRN